MKSIFERIAERQEQYAHRPIFLHMRDDRLPPRERLAFVPYLSYFVLTFADLYRFVLPEIPARDRYQELVNIHLSEEDTHWKWFLTDLAQLELDAEVHFTDVLRFIWSDATLQSRLLAYQMCRMGFGVDSLQKLVLVQAIEATGRVALEAAVTAGAQIVNGQRKLIYFGKHHLDTETGHTLETDELRRQLEEVALAPAERARLLDVVDEVFTHFTTFADEAFRFTTAQTVNRRLHLPVAGALPG
ncbi:MAG TPA: hypothetical protein VER04_13960 [Polyangiaceae bacterium]|nr:hypothetical protein [Polyangiaceae bacterium]